MLRRLVAILALSFMCGSSIHAQIKSYSSYGDYCLGAKAIEATPNTPAAPGKMIVYDMPGPEGNVIWLAYADVSARYSRA
jgi:hypothetical protein